MKHLFFTLVFIALIQPALGDQLFTVEETGVSILFPDDWEHDVKDRFGYLIRPIGEKRKKVRIHMTNHKGFTPEEAAQRALHRTNEIRKKGKQLPEKIFASFPITTQSGIKGQKSVICPTGAEPYLNRYYFQKPDGEIFCVCVYFMRDTSFADLCEQRIVQSLILIR